jgi:metal-responsive CopG/Arc/MetJ family transcriptional regulator
MESITIRIQEGLLESLDEEADEYSVSRSEYIRELIEKGREYDDLERDRDRLERQLGQLIEERETSTEIVEYVEEERSYRSAPIWQRAKWWVLGTA